MQPAGDRPFHDFASAKNIAVSLTVREIEEVCRFEYRNSSIVSRNMRFFFVFPIAYENGISIETAEQYMKQIGDVLDSVQKQDEEFRQVFSVYEQIDGCPVSALSSVFDFPRRILTDSSHVYSPTSYRLHGDASCHHSK